jgi:hypothetical protein
MVSDDQTPYILGDPLAGLPPMLGDECEDVRPLNQRKPSSESDDPALEQ